LILWIRRAGQANTSAIVSKKVFDAAQAVLKRRFRWKPTETKRQPKVFMGLLRCGECGSAITAEIQKCHTYYRCTKKNPLRRCSRPYIREEALDTEISALLKPYVLPADWADAMLSRVKEEKAQSARSITLAAAEKRTETESINLRLRRLLDGFLDGVIERSDYVDAKARLMSQKKSLEEQTQALAEGRAHWLEPFPNWILTAENAGEIAVSGSPEEKKGLVRQVFGSNLVLDGKKARSCGVKPWSLLLENSSGGGMVRGAGLEPATPTVSR
jgi:hypothetical protein